MKKLATLTLAGVMLFAVGCGPKQVFKAWEASGGSRADATVEVGFVYNPMQEKPEFNESQARTEATRRCEAWGYTDAEPFGLSKEQCQHMIFVPFSGMVCDSMLVTRQFQCLGQGTGN